MDEPLVFISAAEPSADLLGEALIRATHKVCPSARFVGIAGPNMVRAGCWPIYDMSRHAAMLLGAARAAGRAIRMLRTGDAHLRRYSFDAAVMIDSPTLHLPLAARARAAGVPVMYYIAPQMWAWGAYRIHRLRNNVDRLAVVLPFEERYFRDRGVDTTFVGHPLVDKLAGELVDEDAVKAIRGDSEILVALLPGSRRHVVEEVLKGQLEVAELISRSLPEARFAVSIAGEQVADIFPAAVRACRVPVHPYEGRHIELIKAADLVLVASGTTTLEVAFLRKPMIVMYNASRLFYNLIGRWFISIEHFSLPNILAGREIVPEFMPYYTSTAPIAERAVELLRREDLRRRMSDDLWRAVSPLNVGDSDERAALILLEMIDKNRQH